MSVRKVQNKSRNTKVVFLAAVARPRFSIAWNWQFNGLPDIRRFPSSAWRSAPAGTDQRGRWRPFGGGVNKEPYKTMVVEKVSPKIQEVSPTGGGWTIHFYQDNAPSHRIADDPEVLTACLSDGFDITITDQPPNSPDYSILDLGFFSSIKSLQDHTTPRTMNDFIAEVKQAFVTQTPATLGKV